MSRHVARLEVTAAAVTGTTHGAGLRVFAIRRVLDEAGYVVDAGRKACLGVAVSFATAGRVRGLAREVPSVWLDATDSWLLTDLSGLRAGDPSYGARLVRDGVRLAGMPTVDLVTWISNADRSADHGTVRGRKRLVLPQAPEAPVAQPRRAGEPPRVVLSGDWAYAPNRVGLDWFARRVLPLVQVPVFVYGEGAPEGPWVRRGYVRDEAELYREGDLHVAPVRFGAGVKNKVLRPLLAGLPVLTTLHGAHGLRPHRLLEIATTAPGFASLLQHWQAHPHAVERPRAADLFDVDESTLVKEWLTGQQQTCALH